MNKILVSLFCLCTIFALNGQILASTPGNGLSDNLSTDVIFFKSAVIAWPEIKLKASLGSLTSTTSIRFNEAMSRGLDFGYDAGMMKSGFDLYTKLVDDNGVDFGIQCLPLVPNEEMVISVGLESSTKGTVAFSVEMSSLPIGFQVTFEDREKGTFTPLTQNSTICTIDVAAKSKITGRFFLHTSYFVPNVVTTTGFSSIAITTATVNGNIVSGSATTRGVVYGTDSLPDISGLKTIENGSFSLGVFSSTLTGLTSNTTYYARAYMTNTGVTYYGNEVSFTTLDKILLTVTADDKQIIYGEPIPELTYTINGFVDGDTLTDLIFDSSNTDPENGDSPASLNTLPKASIALGDGVNAGIYLINVSGGLAENYDFIYVNGKLIVHKAELTVSAIDTLVYKGNTIAEFTLNYRGFVKTDNVAVLDTLPVATTIANKFSTAGEYAIAVSGGSDNNYSFIYVDGVLTVLKNIDVTHLNFKSLQVFPNLFENNITVINKGSGEGVYLLTDAIGKKVYSGTICTGLDELQLSNLKPGIYLLHITFDKEIKTFRLVKQ